MKLISPYTAGDRCILREQFRSAQEVQDRGYVIMGSGITFPGNGVRFTGAAGQRLALPQWPARSQMLSAMSGHCCFTPEFAKDGAGLFMVWAGRRPSDPALNVGNLYLDPSGASYGIYATITGTSFGGAGAQATVRSAWLDFGRNYLSWSVRDGQQLVWLNGVLVGTDTGTKPLPAAASAVAAELMIGCGRQYNYVFNGTIHEITWFDAAMTLEEHLDWMQQDTYSEVWG